MRILDFIDAFTSSSAPAQGELTASKANAFANDAAADAALVEVAGSIYFNTTDKSWRIHDGATWLVISTSEVSGPGSATDDALTRWDGTTGALIQNSVGVLTDAGALSGLTQLDVDNIRTDGNTVSSTDVNGNINLSPNGVGTVVVNTDLDVDNINVNGNSITSTDAAGNIAITPDTTGDLVLDGVNWPQADGTAGQQLQTDGLGQTSWQTPSAGGGGGASLVWVLKINAPIEEDSDGIELLDFDNTSEQEIFAHITVPDTYSAGDQIVLNGGKTATSVTSGNVLYRGTTTLVEPGTTVLGSLTNTHSSTNTELTVPGVASQVQNIGDVDLTTGAGLINAVAVAAGDLLLVKLVRLTSGETVSAAADARLLRFSFIPKFS